MKMSELKNSSVWDKNKHLDVLVPKKKNKYNNRKTVSDGIEFDSKKEAHHYRVLKFQENTGLITGIQLQVAFHLSVCKYVADFVYYDIEAKKFVVADAKGVRTPEYILKCKMMKKELGIEILEV